MDKYDVVKEMNNEVQNNINVAPVTLNAKPHLIRIPLKKMCKFVRPVIVDSGASGNLLWDYAASRHRKSGIRG